MIKIKFSEVRDKINKSFGIYEIHTHSGTPLKVGISKNLQERLSDHGASRQSALKSKDGSNLSNPSEVRSKKSILAKHLFFDKSITKEYDLTTEEGRQSFLENECYILYEYLPSKERPDDEEKKRERSGKFRYVGKVIQR